MTIDGEHARDFDDAITLDRLENGNYWLGVHIADVAHYVPEGSALDEEGYDRATSVYFPERAVHMFPSELATGLCSLNPDVDRLVQSCLMEIDRKGTVVRYELHDGVIHSKARMTYNDVNAILTERDPDVTARYAPLVPLFERMRELFEILNKRRHRRGSIDFDLKEPEIVLDDEGMVEAIIALERNIAHRIIEEFMLVANETVAQHLDDQEVPSLFRVHEDPDPLKVEQFEEFVATLGYTPGRAARRGEAAAFPEAGRADAGHAGGEADRVPDAAHHAEGALRTAESRALRPRGEELHALHLAHPAVSRPDRASHAARVAARRDDGGAARGRSTRTCRRWPGTPRSGSGARPTPSASWCSGRRSASWPTRSATSSTAT